jgi:hypothetical protein
MGRCRSDETRLQGKQFLGSNRDLPMQGSDALGVYYKGKWVPLDSTKDYGFPLPRMTKYYPSTWRNAKISSVLPLLIVMVVSVVIGTFCVLSFRLFVQGYNSFGGALAGGVANALTIIFMNVVWKMVATKLTEWGNVLSFFLY